MITGKTYDVLRWIAQVLLPFVGFLYFIGSGIWDWSNGETFLAIVIIVDLVLGVMLWISQMVYATHIGLGDLLVEEDPQTGARGLRLALDETPEELADRQEVRFKVKKQRQQAEV